MVRMEGTLAVGISEHMGISCCLGDPEVMVL